MQNHQLAIASDHAGIDLKDEIIKFLQKKDVIVVDLGANNLERVDYPDYAHNLMEKIIEGSVEHGILICATGIGMSMTANRSSDIRAALCTTEFMAERARLHNDANILVLGAKIINSDTALKIVDTFLNTEFEGGRHAHRLAKIS